MIFPFPAFLISVDNGDFPVPATLPESTRGPQPRCRAVAAARRKGHPGDPVFWWTGWGGEWQKHGLKPRKIGIFLGIDVIRMDLII